MTKSGAKRDRSHAVAADTDDKWRSKQFHSMHVQRVRLWRAFPERAGRAVLLELSQVIKPIDRATRAPCGACHNGKFDPTTGLN